MGGFFGALVDILTAQASGGISYLRIEDTDKKREVEDGVTRILEGLLGFGVVGRGVYDLVADRDDIQVAKVLCLEDIPLPDAEVTRDFNSILNDETIDTVVEAMGGLHPAYEFVRAALEHGKHVAIEVPAATTLDEIWDLINTSERTRKHCIQLENCVYDFFEMTALNMAQQGLFGEVLHVEGSYIHNLEDYWTEYYNNWRLDFNNENRGDVYPTHGLGPATQVLNIHRGDRMKTLVAMDTKSVNGKKFAKKYGVSNPDIEFQNGDHTLTLIQTEQGKTIHIQHNVMTPQPYNRLFKLTGTKGYASKYPIEGFALSGDAMKGTGAPKIDNLNAHAFMNEEQKAALVKKYYHPILSKYLEFGRNMGHGGMDYVMESRLVYCLQNGLPLDMDVYDMAEWCALAELGAISMDNNCAAVAFPDFTRGHWNDVKGYKHAYATPEQEATVEATADAYTAAQKQAAATLKLWDLYDAAKNAEGKAKVAAEKKYAKAAAKLDAQIAKILKAKK